MTKAAKTNNNNDKAGRKRATSYDVAELAGVSQSAVSRVFQDGASASKAMRDRVMAAADKLGYRFGLDANFGDDVVAVYTRDNPVS